ncbi:hypothetical protein [Reyranella sp.]|jgi:hypothetical protein|uniref:hypothetical protein n=1 Tax=Reyranella sp. TaxID=1929291 RepID=UPI002F9533B3
MRNLKLIIGACLLISTAGCAYYDGYGYPNSYYYGRPTYYGYGYRPYGYQSYGYAYRPYGYRYYDYGFWQDRRADGHG